MLAEPEEKDGPRRCLWVDKHGVPCAKSLKNFKSYVERNRHVHGIHNHRKVKGVIIPLPGVVGGVRCEFCGRYTSRDDGNNIVRHASKCSANVARLAPGVKFKGLKKPRKEKK